MTESAQSASRGRRRLDLDRREAIRAGVAALAGLGISAIAPVKAHAAAGGNFILGQANDAGSSQTTLAAATTYTLSVSNSQGSAIRSTATADYTSALYATGSGIAATTVNVLATGTAGTAVGAQCSATQSSVRAVSGTLTSDAATGAAVVGTISSSAGGSAVVGLAGGVSKAVYGRSTGTGPALRAEIDNAASGAAAVYASTTGTGYALYGQGGKAQLLLEPGATTGAPTSGSHVRGEVYVDSAGAFHTCTQAGTPGTWAPLLTPTVTRPLHFTSSSNEATLFVRQDGEGAALTAFTLDQDNAHPGIDAGGTAGPAVQAWSASDCGVVAYGMRANLHLPPIQGASGPPSSGSHKVGEVYSAAGRLYLCTASGTPGMWEALMLVGRNEGATTIAAAGTALHVEGAAVLDASATVGGTLGVGGAATFTNTAAFAGAATFGGPVSMARSGVARIARKKSSVRVTVPSGLAASASIMCTPQNSGGSGVSVKYARRISANRFEIVLTKKASSAMRVAWMVLG